MNADEKKMIQLFSQCAESERKTILQFAEFLVTKHPKQPVSEAPLPIQRPDSESVLEALKRLNKAYPMLDKSKMLAETSELVTQHVVFRRDVKEVIDQLEITFHKYYLEYSQED